MHRYPKLITFVCSVVAAYVLFLSGSVDGVVHSLNGYGYLSAFIGGILFSIGFTAPFAVVIFIALSESMQAFPAAAVGGVGSLLSDFTMFAFARLSLRREISELAMTRFFRWLRSFLCHERVSERVRLYLLWAVAGLVIASPLPDELGITMIAGVTNIEGKPFAALCYALNTLGILAIILGAQVVTG